MEEKYFKSAGDLAEEVTKESNPFMMGGDLTDGVKKTTTIEEINDYLLTVVSGKKFDYKCELGTLCGAGRTVVSLDKLKEMVLNGYNIVSAKCINSNMIDVEFQEYKKILLIILDGKSNICKKIKKHILKYVSFWYNI